MTSTNSEESPDLLPPQFTVGIMESVIAAKGTEV